VSGDFVAVVRVTAPFALAYPPPSPSGSAFNAAGLVLWQDADNLLLLTRDGWLTRSGEYACCAPMFEVFEGGRYAAPAAPIVALAAFKGDSTTLYLERKGDTVRGAYSNDGKNWEGWRTATTRFARDAQIGVTVQSNSGKPFAVTFDGFEVRQQ
jgi:regulation of enolase protein 1 (concanavalin A-like superfamily)